MQLSTARLCLDCDEVHDAQVCPVCASETFAFLSRWVPSPEPRKRRVPTTPPPPEAQIYRSLIGGDDASASRPRSVLKQGLIGLTAVGLLGWVWRSSQASIRIKHPAGAGPVDEPDDRRSTTSRIDDARPAPSAGTARTRT